MLLQTMPALGRALLTCTLLLGSSATLAHKIATTPVPVAWVNDRAIPSTMLTELLKLRMQGRAASGETKTPTAQDRERALNDLIRLELLSQKAAELGLSTTPAAQADMDYQRKSTLGQRLMRQMTEETFIEDGELQARHNAIAPQIELSVSHILLADEKAARKVLAKLKQGAKFSTVARQSSTDAVSRHKGGVLDTAQASSFAPAFAKAALALAPGERSQAPVETDFGWHVIWLHSKKELPKPSLEDTRATLNSQLVNEKVSAQIERWREESKIERLPALDDPALKGASDAALRLNGQAISRLALDRLLQVRAGSANDAPIADREPVLRELLLVELLAQKARERGLDQLTAVAAELTLQEKTLASRLYLNHYTQQVRIDPEELQALYEADVPPLDFKFSQMVVPAEADARELIAHLQSGGNFAVLAKEHSTDTQSRDRGGDMGWQANNQMNPGIATVVRRLKVGELSSEPVRSEDGWHVIKLVATRAASRPDLNTAKAWLYPKLMQAKVQAHVAELRAGASIRLTP